MKKIFLLLNLIICICANAQIGSGINFNPPAWRLTGNTVATNTAYIGTNDNRVLNVVTNGTLTGMWDSIGRFGIGPGRPLYDFDNRKSKPGTFVRTNTANTFSTGYALNYVTADVASGGIIAFGSAGGVGSLYMNNSVYTAGSSTAAMGIVNQVVGPLIFANGGFATTNEAFRVDVNKNIMIEGAGPTHPLNSGTCTAILHIGAGATKYPPIRLTSTALQTGTNIIAGGIEFLTDKLYLTTTTGPTQYEITLNNIALTSGRIPFNTTNGRLTDNSSFLYDATSGLSTNGITLSSGSVTITTKSINTTAGDAATINSPTGRFRKDTSGSSFTLTNSQITANSIIVLTLVSTGITSGNQLSVQAGAGSATITFETAGVAGAPNADCDVNFYVIN